MSIAQTKINLGNEYDDVLRSAIQKVLLRNNAVGIDASWGVGGSQEIEMLKVRIEQDLITIESETYIGLTISGPKEIIEKLSQEILLEIDSRNR